MTEKGGKRAGLSGELGSVADSVRALIANARNAALAATRENGNPGSYTAVAKQRLLHGFGWMATVGEAIAQTIDWAVRMADAGRLGEGEELAVRIGVGEYLCQLVGGIQIGPNETFRPQELGLAEAIASLAADEVVANLISHGNTSETRTRLMKILLVGGALDDGFFEPDLNEIRHQFRRFATERIAPYAHQWHLEDALIPDALIAEMAVLGTFGVCIPEKYGGLGLGKLAMAIISEELSCAWVGAGSLGTRSEIAGELIARAGTDEQKVRWLPHIASGELLPCAVFTEPDTGSDLARLRTRATQQGDGTWCIDGAKTWITHAARSDLMTVLVRTEAGKPEHGGISVMLAAKQRGTEANPFPNEGLTGTSIDVLGYRGMREYEITFDGFRVDADGLLGGVAGHGFRQLMQTFEGARIQTAARAVGVARRAFELGLAYASERKQFGVPIATFPRISDKLVMMAAEIVMARQLTYFAATQKDKGYRCDIEAGMAKLLAARVAWTNADAGLQIHGGNGYALEFEISRVFCDARVLSIFEGAAEIQAHVIGRGLLERRQ